MQRRHFITLLGGAAAAWPLAARAQQRAPIVGYFSASTVVPRNREAFQQGLRDAGFVEGRNVTIEYRTDEGQMDRLPGIVAELVRRQVSVIYAQGNTAAVTTKAATSTIPIVFTIGGDPVELGLVASFNRPDGNVTGVSFLATATQAKRLELLRELAPNVVVIGALVNPDNANAEADTKELGEAARVLGVQLFVVSARTDRELDTAFAALLQRRVGALVIQGDPLFQTRIKQLATLTVRHAIPAIFQQREFPEAGGLMSYGAHISDANRIAGIYTGRILKGDKPTDLPVQQLTKVELIINNTTAKALGIELPLSLLIRADAVIE